MRDMSSSAPQPERNLALELVRVTEAAAMAAGRWVGRGDKNDADGVAVVLVTHDAEVAARARRQIVMKDGLISAAG